MSDPFMLAIGLLTQMQPPAPQLNPTQSESAERSDPKTAVGLSVDSVAVVPTVETIAPEFSPMGHDVSASRLAQQLFASYPSEAIAASRSAKSATETVGDKAPETPPAIAYVPAAVLRPRSGPQMYRQRVAALQAGQTYTRISTDSFYSAWADAKNQPTYEDWKWLVEREASAIARGQGANRLAVLLGDSISMWFPQDRLPNGRLWLNLGISGDTSAGILSRLSALSATRPDTIYILAGINDLRRGASDREVLDNHRAILRRLHQEHPQAQIILQSILPTRLAAIPNSRIRYLNEQLEAIAKQESATYLDLYSRFIDESGNLRADLTTDGLHLNPRGYEVWQWALADSEYWQALHYSRR